MSPAANANLIYELQQEFFLDAYAYTINYVNKLVEKGLFANDVVKICNAFRDLVRQGKRYEKAFKDLLNSVDENTQDYVAFVDNPEDIHWKICERISESRKFAGNLHKRYKELLLDF